MLDFFDKLEPLRKERLMFTYRIAKRPDAMSGRCCYERY